MKHAYIDRSIASPRVHLNDLLWQNSVMFGLKGCESYFAVKHMIFIKNCNFTTVRSYLVKQHDLFKFIIIFSLTLSVSFYILTF